MASRLLWFEELSSLKHRFVLWWECHIRRRPDVSLYTELDTNKKQLFSSERKKKKNTKQQKSGFWRTLRTVNIFSSYFFLALEEVDECGGETTNISILAPSPQSRHSSICFNKIRLGTFCGGHPFSSIRPGNLLDFHSQEWFYVVFAHQRYVPHKIFGWVKKGDDVKGKNNFKE